MYLESGAGSTILKFGLIFLLVNICLKLFIGILLWRMGMEYKNDQGIIKSSVKYNEEPIGQGDPNILRGQNEFPDKEGRIFPGGYNDNKFQLRQNSQED